MPPTWSKGSAPADPAWTKTDAPSIPAWTPVPAPAVPAWTPDVAATLLLQPVLNASHPLTGDLGNTRAMALSGDFFTSDATVSVSGAGVTVSGVSIVDSHTILCTFTIAAGAAQTARTVTVTTAGGTSNGLTFTVTLSVTKGYSFPGTNNENITLGNLADLNSATRVTTMVFFRHGTIAAATHFGRWNDSSPNDLRDQWLCATVSQKLFAGVWNTVANARAFAAGATVLTNLQRYKATYVFDGNLVGDINRMKAWLGTYTGSHAYSADTQEVLAFSGAAFPALLSISTALNAMLGNTIPGTNSPFDGVLIDVRVWIGRALTATEIAAETELTNAITPSLRYLLDDDTNNSGTLAGFNGTPTANVVPITLTG